jgi:hypothetical protein
MALKGQRYRPRNEESRKNAVATIREVRDETAYYEPDDETPEARRIRMAEARYLDQAARWLEGITI